MDPTNSTLVAVGPEILAQFNSWVRLVIALAAIGLGLLVACVGVRVVRVCAFLLGFGVGAVFGGVVAWRISLDDRITLISTFVTGLVVGLLSLCVVKFGRYVAAAAIGFLPVFLFIQTGGTQMLGGNVLGWSLFGVGVIVACCVLYFARRYVMVVSTSYAGALTVALGVGTFLPGQHVDAVALVNDPTLSRCVSWQCYLLAGAWVVLGTMGLVVQLLMYERPLTDEEAVERAKLMVAQHGSDDSGSISGVVPRRRVSYDELQEENRRLKAAMSRSKSQRYSDMSHL